MLSILLQTALTSMMLWCYDRQTDQTTDRLTNQLTDRSGHREVSFPKIITYTRTSGKNDMLPIFQKHLVIYEDWIYRNVIKNCVFWKNLEYILVSGIQHFPSVPSVSTWMPDHYVADWLTEDIAEFRKITKFKGKKSQYLMNALYIKNISVLLFKMSHKCWACCAWFRIFKISLNISFVF